MALARQLAWDFEKKLSKFRVHVLPFIDSDDLPVHGIFFDFVSDSVGFAAPFGSAVVFELGFDVNISPGWFADEGPEAKPKPTASS